MTSPETRKQFLAKLFGISAGLAMLTKVIGRTAEEKPVASAPLVSVRPETRAVPRDEPVI